MVDFLEEVEQQCFSLLKNQKKQLSVFTKLCHEHINNRTQKIINLLNGSGNEHSKFATKNGMLLIVNQKVITHSVIE